MPTHEVRIKRKHTESPKKHGMSVKDHYIENLEIIWKTTETIKS